MRLSMLWHLVIILFLLNLLWGIGFFHLNARLTQAEILIECLVDWSNE